MNPPSPVLSETEQKRILTEFQFNQAREALEAKKRTRPPMLRFGLMLQAFIFMLALLAYAFTDGKIDIKFIVIAGNPLFFSLLGMFTELCDDTRAIKEILTKKAT